MSALPNERKNGVVCHNGKVMRGEELRKFAEANGLCRICALYQTHEKVVKRFAFKAEYIPIKEKRNTDNIITVYHGYCIQPTCYTLAEAKAQYRKTNRDTQRRKKRNSETGSSHFNESDHLSNTLLSRAKSDNSKETKISTGYRSQEIPEHTDQFIYYNSTATNNQEASQRNQATTSTLHATTAVSNNFTTETHVNTTCDLLGSNISNVRNTNFRIKTTNVHFTYQQSQTRDLQEQRSTSIVSQNSNARAIHQLKECLSYDNYIEFFAKLAQYQSRGDVVKVAFRLLCDGVHRIQKLEGKRDVLQSDGWVKSLLFAAQEHSDDAEMQELLCSTISLLSMTSPRYLVDIVRLEGPQNVLKILHKFSSHQNCVDACCGALFACTYTKRDRFGIIAKNSLGKRTVCAILPTFAVSSTSGKFWAISTLLNIEKRCIPGNTAFYLIRDAIEGRRGIEILIETVTSNMIHPGISAAGLELFYIFSANFDHSHLHDSGYTTQLSAWAKELVINAVEPSVLITGYGLIANLSLMQKTRTERFDELWKINFFTSVNEKLTTNLTNTEVLISGMQMLLNLGDVAFVYGTCLTRAVVQAMKEHGTSIEIATVGCLVLAGFSNTGEDAQNMIVRVDGLGAIETSFRTFALGFDTSYKTPTDNWLECITATCTVIASLVLSPFALEAMKNTNLLVSCCEFLLENKNGLDMPEMVRSYILGALYDVKSNGGMSAEFAINVIMMSRNLDKVESAFVSFRKLLCESPEILNTLIVAGNGQGLHSLVTVMSTFDTSVDIQVSGCVILAMVYNAFPFEGLIPRLTRLELENATEYIETHTVSELEVLQQVLEFHMSNVEVVHVAIMAFSYFLKSKSKDDYAASKNSQLTTIIADGLEYCGEIFSFHHQNENIIYITLAFLEQLRMWADKDTMEKWCPLLLRSLKGVILQDLSDQLLSGVVEVVNCIIEGVDRDDIITSFSDGDTIQTLFCLLDQPNEGLVESTTSLLDVLAKRSVIGVVGKIVRVDRAPHTIMFCTQQYPENSTILSSCFSLASSIAVARDYVVHGEIAENGGLVSIIRALQIHPENTLVQRTACKAFSIISKGIPEALLVELNVAISETLALVLNSSLTDENIMCSLLEILWCICAREPRFKDYFGSRLHITNIVQSMAMYLPNRMIQTAGCSFLWTLSSVEIVKDIIGSCGGLGVIINSLMAHLDSPSIQREALVALKNLATTTGNKRVIMNCGGERAILISMWYNGRDETVLTHAFSALNNIAVDTTTRDVQSVSPEILECVLRGMGRHPGSLPLQRSALFLLKNYSFSAANIEKIAQNRTQFVQHIRTALYSHPECKERAQYLLKKL